MEEDPYSMPYDGLDNAAGDHLLGIDCEPKTQMELVADRSRLELLE